MAIANHNNINITQSRLFINVPVNDIYQCISNISKNEFMNRLNSIIPTINQQNILKNHYWLRYLITRGMINEFINEFNSINWNNLNISPTDFLNFISPHFNNITILQHAINWIPNIDFINFLIENGSSVLISHNNFNPPNQMYYVPHIYEYPFSIITLDNYIPFINNQIPCRQQHEFRPILDFIRTLHHSCS